MTASLFSAHWYRVARARARLAPHVRVQRQSWRGQRWYLLSDASCGRQHRINEAAYQFVGRCDGQRTVHEVWSALLESRPDDAPTQDEVLALLGQLNELQLLVSDQAASADTLVARRTKGRRARRRRMLNPFSFQLPLGDPSRWLARLDPVAQVLFRPGVFWFWLATVGVAALVAAIEWPALRAHAARQFAAPTSLFLAWAIYPVMKGLHELAHALAVRRWGGEVHEAGIGLLFLLPAPYVDASAATAFPKRSQRAAVGAAGVITELALAVLGLVVWMATQPGWVNDIAFIVMGIGVASTLLFNGNPLLRFDAYHVLCDLLDLPNLATRSAAWWSQRLGRWLLGSRAEPPQHAASERSWLWLYAPLSWAYRVALSLTLVLWLGAQWWLLGLAALAYLVVGTLLRPLFAWSRDAFAAAQPGRQLAQVRMRLGLVAALALGATCVVPLPFAAVAPAVVWLPEQAQVRAEVDGFVAEWLMADGAKVQPGDLLVRLSNPELRAQRERLASRLEGLRVELVQQLMRDPSAAQNLELEIERQAAELARTEERIAQLELRAAAAGRLSVPHQADSLGAYVRHGSTLAYVLAPEDLRVRAAVAEGDVHFVRHRLQGAEVRLADAGSEAIAAQRGSDTPAATRRLPSAALADHGGGPIATDPSDKDGLTSLQPLFLVDLVLPGHALERVGTRAWVRFDFGSEPLVLQTWRRASQLFLRHVAPTA